MPDVYKITSVPLQNMDMVRHAINENTFLLPGKKKYKVYLYTLIKPMSLHTDYEYKLEMSVNLVKVVQRCERSPQF